MKAVFALLAAASVVVADNNPAGLIPDCAKPCVQQFMQGSTVAGCNLLDYDCVCKNSDFISKVACCLDPVCDAAGKKATLELAGKLCKGSGADLPTEVKCNTASDASSTAAASSTSSGDSTQSTAATATAGSTDASSTNGASATTTSGASQTSSTARPSNPAAANAAGIVGAAAALAFAL